MKNQRAIASARRGLKDPFQKEVTLDDFYHCIIGIIGIMPLAHCTAEGPRTQQVVQAGKVAALGTLQTSKK